MLIPFHNINAAHGIDVQQLIDDVPAGEVITLDTGVYEGPIVIDKPLTLRGTGEVIIRSSGDDAVMTVNSDKVIIQHITLLDEREQPDSASLMMSGNHHLIEHVNIKTHRAGIRLNQVSHSQLRHVTISKLDSPSATSRRGHGIDLWESHDNDIAHSTISGMMDGIYVERSHRNVIHHNEVTHSRYGYHFMFSDENELTDNTAAHNVSGAMVMGVKRATVRGNVLVEQSLTVNALGLLLYNTHDTVVEANRLTDNRLGLFVEASHNNTITDNELSRNFVGLELLKSHDNAFHNNAFIANVVQAQAIESADNVVQGNFWDDAEGIDLHGRGVSDLPYRVNPLFLTLADAMPAIQVFFASPSLQIFETFMHSPSKEWFSDEQPLLSPPLIMDDDEYSSRLLLGLVGGLLLLGSVIIIIKSEVRRT